MNIRKRLKPKSIFSEYLIYYILILIIPMLIVGTGLGYFIYDYNEKELSLHTEESITLLRGTFDNTFYTIYTSNEMILEHDLIQDAYRKETEDHYVYYEVCEALKNVKTVTPFLENIMIINQHAPYIASSSGTFTKELFGDIYHVEESTIEDRVDEYGSQIIKANIQSGELILYVLEGLYGSGPTKNIFTIPAAYFDGILEETILSDSNIIMTNQENEILYQYGQGMDNLDMSELENQDIVEIDGKGYVVHCLSSKVTPLMYWGITPLEPVAKEVTLLLLILAICTVIVGIVGPAVAYKLAKKMTYPIYKISDMVKLEGETQQSTDFESITQAVSNMSTRLQSMRTQLDDTKSDMLYSNIIKLLVGEVVSLEDLNKLTIPYGLEFANRYYSLGVYHCDVKLESKKKLPLFSHMCIGDEQLFYLNPYDTKYIYVLIKSESNNTDEERQLLEVKEELFQIFSADITLGYTKGLVYFNEISTLYYQGLLALEYRYIMGKGAKIEFSVLEKDKFENLNPFDYQLFYKTLMEGEEDAVIQHIYLYYKEITSSGYVNVQHVKAGIFGIFNFLHDTFPGLASKYQQENHMKLGSYETAEEFLNYMCNISVYIWNELKKDTKKDKFAEINLYIDENYCKGTFNIQVVADQFQMSNSALSKYYKEVAGINISEAVNERKIKKATELLVSTNLTINEIVLQVGYYNSSSFIRKFKDRTGLTPGKYRELYQENSR